jgi:AmmeMemoRadiSam system protein B
VCYISAADLAHVGPRFGDSWSVDQARLQDQSEDDRTLLELACRGDSNGMFRHVADQGDRRRICGLAPTYMMLQAMGPARGDLLKYAQAVAPDDTSCVSFASVAYAAVPP